VRVVCLDAGHRVLLLHWRDPTDGTWLWEPPGGGIEPGESPRAAALRELAEETGLDPAAVGTASLAVHRDLWWNGTHYRGPEDFFVARFAGHRPPVSRDGLLAYEEDALGEALWLSQAEIAGLADRLEPPHLLEVLRELAPDGPWGGVAQPRGGGVA
jgi:8-oxo-dGTP pyrophosphatase MutT (NUDIX family)